MRKFFIPLLLASALAPALAHGQDRDGDRETRRAERASQREQRSADRPQRSQSEPRTEPRGDSDRPARAERAPRLEPSQASDRSARTERRERADRSSGNALGDRDVQPVRQVEAPDYVQPVQQVQAPEPIQPSRRVRQGGPQTEGLADAFRRMGENAADGGDRDDDDRDWRRDRDGRHDWSRDWRKDRRYDWRSHRHHHHSLFRLGRYYDPYGWNYRRWSIGWSLWPSYYGSSFWLDDPWQYRLPPAYGPYRWVRYYDDALLVNIYTGQVVDVIYNFFW
jgi:Ni/Co efflux regulator RcnB